MNSNIEKMNRFIFGSRESTFASFFHDDEDGAHDRLIRAMAVATSPVVVDVFASSPCDSRAASPVPSEASSAGESAVGGVGEDRARWIRERVSTHLLTRDSGFNDDDFAVWNELSENIIVEEVQHFISSSCVRPTDALRVGSRHRNASI